MARSHVDSRLVALAAWCRSDLEGCAEPTELAKFLGLTVREAALPSNVRALLVAGQVALVNQDLDPAAKRLALAHEIAHWLVRAGRCPWVVRADEERFADAFAREYLAPIAHVRTAASVSWAASKFGVSPAVVAAQLAHAGLLPSVLRTADGWIVCASCGVEARIRGCACEVSRRDPQDLLELEDAWTGQACVSPDSELAALRADTAA